MANINQDELTVTKSLKSTSNTIVSGGGYRDITMFYNDKVLIDASDWASSSTGCATLTYNKSAKSLYIPISALKEGDIIQKFRILGGVKAVSTSAATTVDASLWQVTKAAAADGTATSIGAITQLAAASDTAVDIEADVTDTTIADDYQYYILVDVTTANNSGCGACVLGAEVDCKRLL